MRIDLRADRASLTAFLGLLVVASASNAFLATIPSGLVRFGPGGPSGALVVEAASTITRTGASLAAALLPAATAWDLRGRGLRQAGRTVGVVLAIAVCVVATLTLVPSAVGLVPFGPSRPADALFALLSASAGLLPVVVPLWAAIWLADKLGPVALRRTSAIGAAAIAVSSVAAA